MCENALFEAHRQKIIHQTSIKKVRGVNLLTCQCVHVLLPVSVFREQCGHYEALQNELLHTQEGRGALSKEVHKRISQIILTPPTQTRTHARTTVLQMSPELPQ